MGEVSDDPIGGNRALWDELTPIHAGSAFYDVDGFKAGRSSLRHIEVEQVGDVAGKDLLHLQCHFGLDTLSWARLGARVTGVDVSERSIEMARSLADELGIDAEFICADLYDLPRTLDDGFDVVVSTYGILFWLPDIGRWAEITARCTRPGGAVHLVEFHPAISGFGDGSSPEMDSSYFWRPEPVEWKAKGTYAQPGAPVSNRSYQWHHPVGDVVTVLIDAGLVIELLHEHASAPERLRPWLVQDDRGWWRAPHDSLPTLYSVRARKPR